MYVDYLLFCDIFSLWLPELGMGKRGSKRTGGVCVCVSFIVSSFLFCSNTVFV